MVRAEICPSPKGILNLTALKSLKQLDQVMNSEQDLFAFVDNAELEPSFPADGDISQHGIDAALLNEIDVQTEQLDGRQRRIAASVFVPFPVEHVWQILTDYERLADFIPNLTKSRRVPHPAGGIRIEQIGSQSMLKLKFCARVVLDMVEHFPGKIDFSMVEGDFKSFWGSWQLEPATMNGLPGTSLSYILVVTPTRLMPVSLIEKRLGQNLRVNLVSIRERAIELFGSSV